MNSQTSLFINKNIETKAVIFYGSTPKSTVSVLSVKVDEGVNSVDFHFESPVQLAEFCFIHSIKLDDRREMPIDKKLTALEQIQSAPKYKVGFARGSLAFWEYVDFEKEMVRPINEHPDILKGWDRGVASAKLLFNQTEESKCGGVL